MTSHIPTPPICQAETDTNYHILSSLLTVTGDLDYLKFVQIKLGELFYKQ